MIRLGSDWAEPPPMISMMDPWQPNVLAWCKRALKRLGLPDEQIASIITSKSPSQSTAKQSSSSAPPSTLIASLVISHMFEDPHFLNSQSFSFSNKRVNTPQLRVQALKAHQHSAHIARHWQAFVRHSRFQDAVQFMHGALSPSGTTASTGASPEFVAQLKAMPEWSPAQWIQFVRRHQLIELSRIKIALFFNSFVLSYVLHSI